MSELQKALESAKYPVALTGAGISAPSGIPTFDMEWKGKPVRDFLSREYYIEDTLGFFELYKEMVMWRDKQPNLAHRALAHHGVSIVTQNIDGLHQKAGSQKVVEIHGNCNELICRACNNTLPADSILASSSACLKDIIRCRKCNSLLDMGVVLYGDQLNDWHKAVEEIAKADLLLVIGTSLQTYPANQLPIMAERNGCPKITYINSDCIGAFSFIMKNPASSVRNPAFNHFI